MCSFESERLEENIWKVVQDDPYKQYPFMYVLKGDKDRVVLIDTGCPVAEGGMTYRQYLETHPEMGINPRETRYEVVCTHVHFDHVGGNCEFCRGAAELADGFDALVSMGGANKAYTSNYELNSLAAAHPGAVLNKFSVGRWLEDGDEIHLGGGDCLQVLHTPGHTPDSISLFHAASRRLFVGDTLYPYTAVHLDTLGSNVADYVASLAKLEAFVAEKSGRGRHSDACQFFLETLGLTEEAVARQFCVAGLLEICGGDVEQAVNLYLSSPEDVGSLSPPLAGSDNEIKLCAGHVEASLPATAISTVRRLLASIQTGELVPSFVEDGYGEYTDGTYSIFMPLQG